MGLRSDIQADIAEAFDDDLADAVKPFDGKREVTGPYDPSIGGPSVTIVEYSGRGVFGGFRADELNEYIDATDVKLTALQNEVGDDPQVGDRINGAKVVAVMKDPADVSFSLALRET